MFIVVLCTILVCIALSLPLWSMLKMRIERYFDTEQRMWSSRAHNGLGHGMVINKQTGGVQNSVSAQECENRAEYYKKITPLMVNMLTLLVWGAFVVMVSTVLSAFNVMSYYLFMK